MAATTTTRVRAMLDRCAAIDWRKPPYDQAGIRKAYQRWQATLGIDRPIRLVTDPTKVRPLRSQHGDAAWDFSRGVTGTVWMGFAGSPMVRMLALAMPGGTWPPAPAADCAAAVAWAWAVSLAAWRIDENNEQDRSDLANMMMAVRRMAQRAANLRALALLETPFPGVFDPPPRIVSMITDLLGASDNELLWQQLAIRETEFAAGLGMDASVLQQPRNRDEVIEALTSLVEPLVKACESGAFAHGFSDGELIVLASPAIFTDGRRLHRPDGPAIAWRETKVFAWKGCVLPKQFFLQPQTISLDQIRNQADPRVQHALIDIYAHRQGHRRCMQDLGGAMVHEDDTGRLWCINPRRQLIPAEPDDFRLVEVVNGTPEADGSHKTYWLRVPPAVQTAKEAVAWTYGMTPDQYGGLVMRT